MAIPRAFARHKWGLTTTLLLLLALSLLHTDSGLAMPAMLESTQDPLPLDINDGDTRSVNQSLSHVPENIQSYLLDLDNIASQEIQPDSDLHRFSCSSLASASYRISVSPPRTALVTIMNKNCLRSTMMVMQTGSVNLFTSRSFSP